MYCMCIMYCWVNKYSIIFLLSECIVLHYCILIIIVFLYIAGLCNIPNHQLLDWSVISLILLSTQLDRSHDHLTLIEIQTLIVFSECMLMRIINVMSRPFLSLQNCHYTSVSISFNWRVVDSSMVFLTSPTQCSLGTDPAKWSKRQTMPPPWAHPLLLHAGGPPPVHYLSHETRHGVQGGGRQCVWRTSQWFAWACQRRSPQFHHRGISHDRGWPQYMYVHFQAWPGGGLPAPRRLLQLYARSGTWERRSITITITIAANR